MDEPFNALIEEKKNNGKHIYLHFFISLGQ